jgi:ABC-type oligopeptide transport system substrate-binding subunit
VVEAHGEAWTEPENMVTNGPFRLASWQPDESLVLVRNPTYHGRFTGNLERVELSLRQGICSEPLEMYEAGSLDVLLLGFVPLPEYERARKAHAGEIVSAPWLATNWVSLFPAGPPLDDVRVRRALVLAADRETLADVVLGGIEFPATGGFVPPGMPGHSPGIALPYDPELAQQLLAEAGYARGQGFPPVDAFFWSSWHEDYAAYLKTQWYENLGIEIRWERVDPTTRTREFQRGELERPHLFLSGWSADYPDPDNFLRLAIHSLRHSWDSNDYEQLIEEASRLKDQVERMVLYRQADRMIVEEAVVLPLTYGRQQVLVKPWVARYPLSAVGNVFWKDVVIEPH